MTSADTSGRHSTVRGACPHDCPDTCALITTVEDGVAIRVQGNPEHRHTDGALCTKVSRYTERTYHPERILHPLKRAGPKGSGQFAPVSWDEALDTIAAAPDRPSPPATLRPSCPTAMPAPWDRFRAKAWPRAFSTASGASHLERTICASAGGEALVTTLGAKVGMKVEHFAESRLILIWGSNSIASNLHFWRVAQQAKRNGARLVCIDPRRSETADKCHEHIALRPGTDAALALSLMHQLITHDWLDHDYIAQHTLGWEGLRERALLWPPERAAEVCGIPEQQIIDLARGIRHHPTRGDPPELRHAAGARRRQCGAGRGLPARPGRRLAAPRWRHAAVVQRPLPGPARGPAPARPARRPHVRA